MWSRNSAYDLSISHTDELACVAIGHRCRLGVDVEARCAIEPSLSTAS
jgi:phosphopantetheinyl transferase